MTEKYHFNTMFPVNIKAKLAARLCGIQITEYCQFVLTTLCEAFYGSSITNLAREIGYLPRLTDLSEGHLYKLYPVRYHTVVLFALRKVMAQHAGRYETPTHERYEEVAHKLERAWTIAINPDVPRKADVYSAGDGIVYYCRSIDPVAVLPKDGSPGKLSDTLRLVRSEAEALFDILGTPKCNFDSEEFTCLDVSVTEWDTFRRNNNLSLTPNLLE